MSANEGTGPEAGEVVNFKSKARKPTLEVVGPAPEPESPPEPEAVEAPEPPEAADLPNAPEEPEADATVALLNAADVKLLDLSNVLYLVQGHADATTLINRYHEALSGIAEEAQHFHGMLATLVQALQAQGIDPDKLVEDFTTTGDDEEAVEGPTLKQIPCPMCHGEWTLVHKALVGPVCPMCEGANEVLVAADSEDSDGEDAGEQE